MARAKLNPKQQRFIAAYVVLGNATAAAKEAGYSEQTAYSQGADLLKHPVVKTEIELKLGRALDKYEVTHDRIVQALATMAFANMNDYTAIQDDGSAIVDLGATTREEMGALTGIEVEEYVEGRGEAARTVKRVRVKMADRQTALMNLAKITRMLPADRLEHTGANGGPIETVNAQLIEVRQLDPEQRAQLRAMLSSPGKAAATDVEDLTDEDE